MNEDNDWRESSDYFWENNTIECSYNDNDGLKYIREAYEEYKTAGEE